MAFLARLINTSRLSASLLTRILLFSGLFTIIITSLQLYLDYKDEIQNTLKEWHRVLEPKGKLKISVPDLDILCQLFLLKEELNTADKFRLMRMIFGGHLDEYDYHYTGLNGEFLHSYLHYAGFINIKKVKNFGLFDDDSNATFKGVPICLNVEAEKA